MPPKNWSVSTIHPGQWRYECSEDHKPLYQRIVDNLHLLPKLQTLDLGDYPFSTINKTTRLALISLNVFVIYLDFPFLSMVPNCYKSLPASELFAGSVPPDYAPVSYH